MSAEILHLRRSAPSSRLIADPAKLSTAMARALHGITALTAAMPAVQPQVAVLRDCLTGLRRMEQALDAVAENSRPPSRGGAA